MSEECPEKKVKVRDASDYIDPRILKAAEKFVEEATKRHGGLYSYANAEYVGSKIPLLITCSIHGDFLQTPNLHLKGNGCRLCWEERRGKSLRLNTEEFIEKAIKVHGSKYDYSRTEYETQSTKVIITCPMHGEFPQWPNDHLQGAGCPDCKREYVSKTLSMPFDDFKRKAEERFGGRFEYHEDSFTNATNHCKITCREHGVFYQVPAFHLISAHGCPSCSTSSFRPTDDAYVYVLESQSWVKVGITRRQPSQRVLKINRGSPEEFRVVYQRPAKGWACRKTETATLNWLKTLTTQVGYKFDGSTETFLKIPVELIINKIEEFAKEIEDGRASIEEDGTSTTDHVRDRSTEAPAPEDPEEVRQEC